MTKAIPSTVLSIVLLATACSKKHETDLSGPPPVIHTPHITSLSPASAAIGDTVTIGGTDFSMTGADNAVTFRRKPATVLEPNATMLKVEVPLRARDGRIAVRIGDRVDSTGIFNYIFPVSTLA